MKSDIQINITVSDEIKNSFATMFSIFEKIIPIFDENSKKIKDNEVKIVTLEKVREVLAKLSQDGKQHEVKALIEKLGGKKLTDVSEDKYPELLREAELIFNIEN
ncbi:rRNA biogenesis protein rrp5 [Clostridium tyrobutyricum]|jgi:hypothetical protein|uniref:rRNA biogenesis protein rrp5 n=1 Tax=Clostridium tyrobutyricum TaxID=1519 RepID=UPI001C38E78E|nr:rRNA biogenesis protein rrp5 [Clostridium tyrobutyricum]MBV4425277.1 rRNA biogenesis protein rrp5 [Clostridium tyrobutyricum]